MGSTVMTFAGDALMLLVTGDYHGGSFGGLTEEDSLIVSIILTIHHAIF